MRSRIITSTVLGVLVLALAYLGFYRIADGGCGGGSCSSSAVITSQPATSTAPAAKVFNTVCPIMGSTIDPATVPDNLTRQFDGKIIGFCCGGCPAAWDKLTDEQKRAKLAALAK